ncbi:MAG TPA: hypothetical protein VHM28_09025, partial [Anaerolineales bacterium]|nr:hypothetical protein [Anaerolineales bacterium]
MNQPISSQAAQLAGEVMRLKRYMIDSIARGIESEGIPADRRAEFVRQHVKSVYERAHINLPEDLQRVVFRDVSYDLL